MTNLKAKKEFNDLFLHLTGIANAEVVGLMVFMPDGEGRLSLVPFQERLSKELSKELFVNKTQRKRPANPDAEKVEEILKKAHDFYNETSWTKSDIYRHMDIETKLGYSLRQFNRKLNQLINNNK